MPKQGVPRKLVARLPKKETSTCVVIDIRVVLRKDDYTNEALERGLDEFRGYGMAEVLREGVLEANFNDLKFSDIPKITFEAP